MGPSSVKVLEETATVIFSVLIWTTAVLTLIKLAVHVRIHYYHVTNELIINIMNKIKVALIVHSAASGNFNASVTTTSSCGNCALQKNLK